MARFKKPLLFALCLLPVAAVAGIFATIYQIDLYPDEVISELLAQFGSTEALIAVAAVQTGVYALFFGFFGCILAEKIGLWRPFKFKKKSLAVTLFASVIGGVLLSLDYWTFGSVIDGLQEGSAAMLTVSGVIGAVLYGGVIEELMMRLFFMSLVAFVLWKLFCRKYDGKNIPTAVFLAANIVSALAFAAGHLPSTLSTFGTLTPLLLIRCFLLNGGFGLVFGRLYRKYGIGYAMLSHALCHIVSKLIWLVLI